ncbi:GntR family transcriptional regulator [Chelatococcus sp. GCM10030263]|uniref:GntR family transcriptional regulator n=1 Tax=Chelatococcus sp. GCM10030263 TaxID=3273387 RepID=UPI003620ED5B
MSFATKQDWVAEIIRERIIVGHYGRGDKLKQADLAAELGVSITPVREALLMLEAEGYVRGLPHKGLLVPEFIPGQLREIFELRVMLERELTAVALSKLTPGKFEELKDLQRTLVKAIASGDLQAVRTANFRFHFRLYEIAERPQTLHFVRVLWAKYPFTMQDVRRDRPVRMRSEHDVFLQKIEEDDLAGAVEAMVQHIKNGWREGNLETTSEDGETKSRRPRPQKRAEASPSPRKTASRPR